MSKNTNTQAPKQKKNVGYRLVALLFFFASVAVLFLPIGTFTSAWAIEEKTLLDTVKALLSSDVKLFGVLPALVETTGTLAITANLALYLFALGLVLTIVISFFAIVSRKNAPRRARRAVFCFTWGSAVYALSLLCITSYVDTLTYDLYSTALALVGTVFYFILMLAKNGKGAWLPAVQFLLSLGVAALLILAMTYDGLSVSEAFAAKPLHKTILLAIVAFLILNLFIASIRAMVAKKVGVDMVRYILQLLVALLACYVSYDGLDAEFYLVLVIGAAVVSVIQIVLATLQLSYLSKLNAANAKEELLAEFGTEEYVEAYAYEGGPVAGVEVAEEVTPTMAAANGTQPDLATLVGNGFDPFMSTLSPMEKSEFIDLYILRCRGLMPEIPGYVVGDTNKDFFNYVFIYLGQHREKISSGLLQKMYDYSMKL